MDSNLTITLIEEAVELIINTRDLCGNERRAVIEFARENGLNQAQSDKLRMIANFRANAKWRGFQKAAGVPEKWIW